ncbi:hypothetical protein Tco_0834376 [Tanacetum coccineum]
MEIYSDALNALNDVPFPLLDSLGACADQKLFYLEAIGGDQFIIALSVPYARDTGVLNIEVVAPEGVETIETDVGALAGTRLNYAATPIIPSLVEVEVEIEHSFDDWKPHICF